MNRRLSIRTLALVLLLALIGASALADTPEQLLQYAQEQGFKCVESKGGTGKPSITYTERSQAAEKLTWTTKAKKTYTITAKTDDAKKELRNLCVYMTDNCKWTSATYKLNSTVLYGYGVKKAKKRYSSLSKYRAAVRKHVAGASVPKSIYVLNVNSKKFHLPECRDVARISAKNRKTVEDTRANILRMGYSPCQHCNP